MKAFLTATTGVAVVLMASVGQAQPVDPKIAARVERVLAKTPLIDGHNDVPWAIRQRVGVAPDKVDLGSDTSGLKEAGGPGMMTDIPRLRAGRLGGQFWSVYIPASFEGPIAVEMTLEQIDIAKSLSQRYPTVFEMAYSADDIMRIHKAGRIASLVGIEGGHQIHESLPVLRQMYAAGARYMTLTHSRTTSWADSATDTPRHGGLSAFGRAVVTEMNRLGMLVDLSHVSEEAMLDALDVTQAPVIFSHSSARGLNDHPRNVPDAVLARMKANRGVVMVTFVPGFVARERMVWSADRAGEQARTAAMFPGQPDRAKAALADWDAAHPQPPVALAVVADHIEHVAKACGVDCVGIGGDFDGIADTPDGLDGVDKYPALFAELARRGWSDEDLGKLAGGNVLRVLREAEAVAQKLQATTQPSYATVRESDGAKRP
jgi:membrane dipeptidase